MSAVILLTPIVIATWPAFSAAVISAATALGYAQAESLFSSGKKSTNQAAAINLEIANSTVMTDQLGRDQKITVTRDGVSITFRRDERGKASLTVSGETYSHEKLRALGEELSKRVVQQYIYQQIMAEVDARQYVLVDQSVDAQNAIHLTVRHWQD
jgi:tRNA(Phe) wybutosine-synthesizing methylase Tyw3